MLNKRKKRMYAEAILDSALENARKQLLAGEEGIDGLLVSPIRKKGAILVDEIALGRAYELLRRINRELLELYDDAHYHRRTALLLTPVYILIAIGLATSGFRLAEFPDWIIIVLFVLLTCFTISFILKTNAAISEIRRYAESKVRAFAVSTETIRILEGKEITTPLRNSEIIDKTRELIVESIAF